MKLGLQWVTIRCLEGVVVGFLFNDYRYWKLIMFFLAKIRPKSSWYVSTTRSIQSLHITMSITNQRVVTGTIKKPYCLYQVANHEVITSQRNFSSSSSGRRNSWLNDHTNYNRNRHRHVNRSTGTVFLVITSISTVASIMIMGKS